MTSIYVAYGYKVCKVLSDALTKKQNNIKVDAEESAMYNFCKRQKLITIIGSVVSSESVGCDKIIKETKALTLRQIKRAFESDKVSALFDSMGIPHIIQKGTTLAKFYESHIMRDSADIDMYVPYEFVDKASDVLKSHGYTLEKINNSDEFCFHKPPRYCVELHTKLSGFNSSQKEIFSTIAKKYTDSNTHVMNDSDNYICTLFHLYKHLVLSGVGVRMFLDIYMMQKNGKLDRNYIDEILLKLNILEFERVVGNINAVLFENKPADDDQKAVIEFIFTSGIYGTELMHNNLSQINGKAIDKSKKQKFLESNGISFSAMSKRYPVLKRVPLLYPFSFIHRFFYGIFNHRESLKEAQKVKNMVSQDTVSQYKKIFDTLHIDTD